jgi:hypothetical protein
VNSYYCIDDPYECVLDVDEFGYCTLEDPPEDSCFTGESYCDEGGFCIPVYHPAGTPCEITPKPNCAPLAECAAVEGGITMCTPVPGTAVSKVTSFTLVDSAAPNTTYELDTFSTTYTLNYREKNRCNYNIRVNTQDCEFKVDSVLMQWDLNVPKKGQNYGNYTYCEEYTPYAVFGDGQRGTPKDLGPYSALFDDVTFSLGTHTLTATPYSGSVCNGTAGVPLNATVQVVVDGKTDCPGAVANVEIFNATSRKPVGSLTPFSYLCLPSNYTFRACVAPCRDGEIKWVHFYLEKWTGGAWTFERQYNDTTKTNFYFHESANGAAIGGSGTALANGLYQLTMTPYGNIWNNTVVPARLISSFGQGDPYSFTFTVDCSIK